ncbi:MULTISPECIES: helix-turn-helix domain-containing protein [Rhodobacterales]|uniref:Helix-turn-helix domain-containing protein n=1 Tax=Halocynthiibacter styelae TaxID=2761955 RepID=A0A8J7LKF0_9RHOB|nr:MULTISPECIES: helix-turn-helix domain-containing protein [Rhodobacterales]MBI1492489.1 helix-turn-helix domain-containing protein [Paenihalocynthiibacter styelae]
MDDAENDWFSAEYTTFGDRVAGAREALGMTQQELSRRLGVKLKTIRAWENDISEPRSNKIMRLSGLLNVSIMFLLNGEGDGLEAPEEQTALAPGVEEILTEIRDLKTQINQSADRLGRLEKNLRTILKAG